MTLFEALIQMLIDAAFIVTEGDSSYSCHVEWQNRFAGVMLLHNGEVKLGCKDTTHYFSLADPHLIDRIKATMMAIEPD